MLNVFGVIRLTLATIRVFDLLDTVKMGVKWDMVCTQLYQDAYISSTQSLRDYFFL